jgi:methylenetetrahydrofolate reductase (NADPH)
MYGISVIGGDDRARVRLAPYPKGGIHLSDRPFGARAMAFAAGGESCPLGRAIPALRASTARGGQGTVPLVLDAVRYEVMPFGSPEEEARSVARPLTLTVTCSPRHGVDHSLRVSERLAALGHTVVLHVAARGIRGPEHLDRVLERTANIGVRDVFLVGGDGSEALGPYHSALDLLPALRAHPHAPRSVGVAAYPEGHPFIDDATLLAALAEKDGQADYMTSQLCFDAVAFTRWLERMRAAGIGLPLYVGMPGAVDRRKLVEISLRVGVGASVAFVRKQHAWRRLLGRPLAALEAFHAGVAALAGNDLGVAGSHFFTLNRLVATVAFAEQLSTHPTRSDSAHEQVR